MTRIIKGDLILTEDYFCDEDLKVEGSILGKNGERFNLNVEGNINCWDITCRNIDCWDITCRNIDCWDINCVDINCWDITCRDINCWDISFYAICVAYYSFKCKSAKARRYNFVLKCLDQPIEYINKKVCDKCGRELEE